MEIYKEIIKNNSLCFDIGANIGNKTDIMLKYGTKVVCVEPQKNCVNKLNSRFKNNLNVFIVEKGCGDKIGTKKLFISQFDTLSTMSQEFIDTTKKERFKGVSWYNETEVEITTLDYLIEQYGLPHFCKIDIEGYEYEVLLGLTQAIPYLSLEFTPELKENTFKCIDYILKLDENYLFNYSEGESGIFTFVEWVDGNTIKQFLSKNNDFKISFGDVYARK